MTYRNFGLGLLLSATLFACGGEDSPTPPPSPSPTIPNPIPPKTSIHLEKFAKISANPADNLSHDTLKAFESINVADGQGGNGKGTSAGVIWRVDKSAINSASVKFEWNSQVRITAIHIWDNPKIDQKIMSGRVSFENTIDSSATYPSVDFSELPDGQTTASGSVSPPTGPVTSVTVGIQSHKGDDAGIAEIYILGYRVDEKIEEMNLSPYLKTSASSILGDALSGVDDTGTYRTARVKDGKADTFWASDGNGENGSITLEADQVFAITSIELKDLPSSNHCRFKKARVVFPELSPAKSFDFLEKSSATLTTTLDLPEEIKAKKMQIEFLSGGIVAGSGSNKNCGFSEIAVTGSYTPP